MLTKQVFDYHMSKIASLMKLIEKNYVFGNRSSEMESYINQTIDLLHLIKNNVKPISWYEAHYKGYVFTPLADDPNYKWQVTSKGFQLTWEQAVVLRNRLLADGLVWFVIIYEEGGKIDSDYRFDNPDHLLLLKQAYSQSFIINRSSNDSERYFLTPRPTAFNPIVSFSERLATELANKIKRQHPSTIPVVYYFIENETGQPTRAQVIGKDYDNSKPSPEAGGVDLNPYDT